MAEKKLVVFGGDEDSHRHLETRFADRLKEVVRHVADLNRETVARDPNELAAGITAINDVLEAGQAFGLEFCKPYRCDVLGKLRDAVKHYNALGMERGALLFLVSALRKNGMPELYLDVIEGNLAAARITFDSNDSRQLEGGPKS